VDGEAEDAQNAGINQAVCITERLTPDPGKEQPPLHAAGCVQHRQQDRCLIGRLEDQRSE
jgi:hypothetical protein